MEIRSGVRAFISWCSGHTGLTSVLPRGSVSFNWHLFQCSWTTIPKRPMGWSLKCLLWKEHFIQCIILPLKLVIIVLSFNLIEDLSLLASVESLCFIVNSCRICEVLLLVSFKVGLRFFRRCKMIFLLFQDTKTHTSRHLFKQGGLMNTFESLQSVRLCFTPP